MGEIRISVVIPVYNTEKYIKKCLNSLVNQTYDNYEIITVNDGSTDKSEKIIKNFTEKYSNVRLISQKNAGASAARKKGVAESDGDYILFVDSDDWVDKNILQKCAETINKTDADMVQFGAANALGIMRKKPENLKKAEFSREEFLNTYVYGLAGGYGMLSRGITKVYRKSLIEKALEDQRFNLKIWEDGYMNTLALTSQEFNKGIILDECLYYYRKGSGITSSTDEVMQYSECMKSKAAIYDVLLNAGIKDYFLQVCLAENIGMTRYYLIYQFKHNPEDKRMQIVEDTFRIPAVVQAREYMSAHPDWNDSSNEFILYSIEKCCEYIETQSDITSPGLSAKIKLFLHKIL